MKIHEALAIWDEPPFNRQAGMKEILDAANLVADMPAKTLIVAGLLSTLDLRPSKHHPEMMVPMAKQVIELLIDDEVTEQTRGYRTD